ncbi:glycosyltransferase family 57 protein [Cystobasidium minutum MCA 4210]|uniref:glycosyltransferase family 57 protein n=1 Tax=Cystobasidium minutum MCA 4210 TaxID=1397322 RepID=UPI0034CD6685|eukprot:jgi/Rhomi1/184422/fgenesh1_pm.7_\
MESKSPIRAFAKRTVGREEVDLLVASTFAKILLFPAYRSTDFEVHRNWLAVTQLPLSQWYHENTSEWTLDYPPFFAYFERALSSLAFLVHPEITRISKEAIAIWPVVAFQRTSVIASEIVLLAALYRYIKSSDSTTRVIAASLFLHPGLLIVDSIHFQYNGMLLGLLLLSLVQARDGKLASSAFFFAVLLNFKHIFVYLAPPYLVYLLRAYCFSGQVRHYFGFDLNLPTGVFQAHRFVLLGMIVGFVAFFSFAPFLYAGGLSQFQQILSRLFPFQRGLNHAYWAGNVWAIYSAVDRVLVKYLIARGLPVSSAARHSASRGLIGDIAFGVLPEPKPVHCFLIAIALNTVYTTKLWTSPSYQRFLKAVTLSAFTSFLFGFHVHEKAILLVLFPLSLLAATDFAHYRIFLIASVAGIVALFPLLIDPMETPIKLIYSAVWLAIIMPLLSKSIPRPSPSSLDIFIYYGESLYLAGFPLLQLFVSVIHPWYFKAAPTKTMQEVVDWDMEPAKPILQFLPLMLTSIYCAVGIIWAWLRFSYLYFR